MKKLIGIMAAAAAVLSTAAAQNNFSDAAQAPVVANPTTVLKNFDIQRIGPVLTELGVTWQTVTASDGTNAVVANYAGVINFYMQPTACQSVGGSNCVGLLIFSPYEGSANPQTVRAFNDRYPFTRTTLDASGGAFITRYDIADYGVPRGNVAHSITNFLTLANRFQSELSSASQTVSLEGYADDLAASSLNLVGLKNLTGETAHASLPNERHQQSFDEATDNIVRLIADKSLPRNKIKNLK